MAGLGQHPPHDVLAPLVQGDLDQRALTGPVDDPEPVRGGHAVVELDPGGQPTAEILGTGPVTSARYVFATSKLGCASRWASSPSLVSTSGPRCRSPAGRCETGARRGRRGSRPRSACRAGPTSRSAPWAAC